MTAFDRINHIKRIKRARTMGAFVVILTILIPAVTLGQTAAPEKARAQTLYDQATADMDAGNYQSACPKLEEVTKLAPDGLGAKLTLAQCYEAAGKRASAWAQYTLVEELAAIAVQEARLKTARAKAAALKPQLATLSIEVPDDVRSIPGLSIMRDGVPVENAQWGLPLPVDTGTYEVTATAPGRKDWKQSAEVQTDGVKLVVRIMPLEMVSKPGPITPPPAPAKPPASQRPWQKPVGIGVMALGGAGVVIGAVLGGLAVSKNGQSNEDNHCDALNRCDDAGLALREEALGFATGSNVAIVAGAVVLAGGVVLFATAPSAPKANHAGAGAERWSAQVKLVPGGLRLKGSW